MWLSIFEWDLKPRFPFFKKDASIHFHSVDMVSSSTENCIQCRSFPLQRLLLATRDIFVCESLWVIYGSWIVRHIVIVFQITLLRASPLCSECIGLCTQMLCIRFEKCIQVFDFTRPNFYRLELRIGSSEHAFALICKDKRPFLSLDALQDFFFIKNVTPCLKGSDTKTLCSSLHARAWKWY